MSPFIIHVGPAAARRLLQLNDLNWQGYFRIAAASGDSSAVGGAGTTSFGYSAIGVRYVSGQRRILMANFTAVDGTTGQQWGDLVEYALPTSGGYTGNTPLNATALTETRRWANWTNYSTWSAGGTHLDAASGERIGWLYWDETNGVIWYSIYGYYHSWNQPLFAASQLLDTPTGVGDYATVGTKYGPWWYDTNDNTDRSLLPWKAGQYYLFDVPLSAQGDIGKNKILGASVGAVSGTNSMGQLGPGMHGVNLPTLVTSQATLPLGKLLADYSPAFGSDPTTPNAHRDTSYSLIQYTDHMAADTGLRVPVGPTGYWCMSMDQIGGAAWVETTNKQGILMFGRRVTNHVGYGYNPIGTTLRTCNAITHSGTTATATVKNHFLLTGDTVTIAHATPGDYNGTWTITSTPDNNTLVFSLSTTPATDASWDGTGGLGTITAVGWDTSIYPNLVDVSRDNPGPSNGYMGETFNGAIWCFDPLAVRQAGTGAVPGTSAGVNPTSLGDWSAQWPNMPVSFDIGNSTPGLTRKSSSVVSNGMFWDTTAQQLIYVQPTSTDTLGLRCTINLFTIT